MVKWNMNVKRKDGKLEIELWTPAQQRKTIRDAMMAGRAKAETEQEETARLHREQLPTRCTVAVAVSSTPLPRQGSRWLHHRRRDQASPHAWVWQATTTRCRQPHSKHKRNTQTQSNIRR
mmetsp:Transcript_37884/g.86682  ORF Transcript_37884/g.86682 Transcript_37884/m.86682 type:complete len:120 (+) Transcript_37884:1423-1782(+)